MLGHDDPYARQPYFFTDQYDLGLEYVGHLGPDVYDEVVIRGDLRNRQFTALWIRNNYVIADMHTNVWDAIDPIRACIGRDANPALRDPTVELTEIPASSQEQARQDWTQQAQGLPHKEVAHSSRGCLRRDRSGPRQGPSGDLFRMRDAR